MIFDRIQKFIQLAKLNGCAWGEDSMDGKLRIVYNGGAGEIVEKKSRFIGHVSPVSTEENALAFIQKIKKEHWNATHNCFAYIIGEKNQLQRCSDDGEPNGTAGRPMLDVLLGEEIHNVVVVVTRYFGGTLLGTGGLVRAYQQGTKAGLDASVIVEKKAGVEVMVGIDYTHVGKVQYIINHMGLIEQNSVYTDSVQMQILTPVYLYDSFAKKVTEITNGKAQIQRIREIYYADVNGKIVVDFS